MINDPERVLLRVDIPMFSADPPALSVRRFIDDDGGLVIRVWRNDGEPFTEDGALVRFDVNGEPYVSFVGLMT